MVPPHSRDERHVIFASDSEAESATSGDLSEDVSNDECVESSSDESASSTEEPQVIYRHESKRRRRKAEKVVQVKYRNEPFAPCDYGNAPVPPVMPNVTDAVTMPEALTEPEAPMIPPVNATPMNDEKKEKSGKGKATEKGKSKRKGKGKEKGKSDDWHVQADEPKSSGKKKGKKKGAGDAKREVEVPKYGDVIGGTDGSSDEAEKADEVLDLSKKATEARPVRERRHVEMVGEGDMEMKTLVSGSVKHGSRMQPGGTGCPGLEFNLSVSISNNVWH